MQDMDKLCHLIEHWIEHNHDHARSYAEWAERARRMGRAELAAALEEAVAASERLGELFQKAGKAASGTSAE